MKTENLIFTFDDFMLFMIQLSIMQQYKTFKINEFYKMMKMTETRTFQD